ncbi:MAG: MFS transporter [Gemmatimonadaceae bacterium]|nr:MFS transporter [Gemmatimonadaceae bacterium]NUO95001.1 MFS transporter [Gemmatimonadaceae bacterium]NUP55054.1 MFS transporter [Gemmatimonadaceae bacterium]NUP71299.1 MFS transporter [Gemmatimonadaceae bacterium]NUR33955.1 MFS transporter [Gemmatimonadaceae bacterium]
MHAREQDAALPSLPAAEDARRWRMLALIALAELLGMCVWFAANAVAPQLATRWALTPAETGWLTTVVQLGFVGGTALAALLNLADVVPARAYFSVCAVAAAVANASLLAAPGYRTALLCRALTGVCLAGVYPPAMKMAATWFRARRGLAIGVVVGALTIGKALPFLIHALPGTGVAQVVLAASGLALVAAALVGACYADGPAPFPRRPFDLALVGTVLRDAGYRRVLGGYSGHMLELYACWIWVPSFLAASELARAGATGASAASASWIALLSFTVLAVGAVGCVLGGELADRVGYVRLVVYAMAVSGACALATPFVFGRSPLLLVPLLLLWSVAVIADSAQFSTLVTRVVAPHAIGTALTLQTSIGFLLTSITVQLVPVVAGRLGWQYAFPVLALGPAIGIAAIRRLRV